MMDIVELIDYLNGELWPFIHPAPRVKRLKRPLEEKLRERGELIEEEEEEEEEEEGEDEEEDDVDGEPRRKEKQDSEGDVRPGTGKSERTGTRIQSSSFIYIHSVFNHI